MDNLTVTTNWPGSNIAKGVFQIAPENGREARKLMAEALTAQGFVMEGSLGKPIRKGVYMVAIAPMSRKCTHEGGEWPGLAYCADCKTPL